MKLIDNDLCDICSNEIEDIMHLFVKCTELYNFHMYVSKQVEELFENCDSDQKNYIVYEEIFILGLNRTIKGVNVNFINFMLSVARYCVFRRRNLVKNNMNSIDIIRLFKYTLKHYVVYFWAAFWVDVNKCFRWGSNPGPSTCEADVFCFFLSLLKSFITYYRKVYIISQIQHFMNNKNISQIE
jgi:hypothetical protein